MKESSRAKNYRNPRIETLKISTVQKDQSDPTANISPSTTTVNALGNPIKTRLSPRFADFKGRKFAETLKKSKARSDEEHHSSPWPTLASPESPSGKPLLSVTTITLSSNAVLAG